MIHAPMTTPHYFIVAGVSLKSIQKDLKPALPRRRQKNACSVVITTAAESVKLAIAGAAIQLPAIASGSFTAEVPYHLFEFVLTYPYENGALVRFELGPGLFSVNGMATKSTDVVFNVGGTAPSARRPVAQSQSTPETPAAIPAIANPLDATIGLPLMTAYIHLRKFGFQPYAANHNFYLQQIEVDQILKKVDRALRPLGITRSDLECLLDKRAGLV